MSFDQEYKQWALNLDLKPRIFFRSRRLISSIFADRVVELLSKWINSVNSGNSGNLIND